MATKQLEPRKLPDRAGQEAGTPELGWRGSTAAKLKSVHENWETLSD